LNVKETVLSYDITVDKQRLVGVSLLSVRIITSKEKQNAHVESVNVKIVLSHTHTLCDDTNKI
jgi:hypothetical protein